MRETAGRNAQQVEKAEKCANQHGVDLRSIELDVSSEKSCETAVQRIIATDGRIDVIIHNAGHMVFGPAEAFTVGRVVRHQRAEHATYEPGGVAPN